MGYGRNVATGRDEAFLWRRPLEACEADFNGDEQVEEDARADVNGDRQIDFFDYLDFVAVFDAGCH